MKKIVRLTESDLIRLVKRIISEQDTVSNENNKDIDPVKYLSDNLKNYKVESAGRKLTGFTALYNGTTPDKSNIVINIYHPLDGRNPYYISVNKNGKETKFEGTFGKKLFDRVIAFV